MPRTRHRTRGQKANAAAKRPVLSAQEKADRKLVVKSIARDLHSIQEQGRKHSYGAVGRELKRAQNLYPWVTKGMVNFQIDKIKKEGGRTAVILLPGDNVAGETESETEDESDPITVGRPRGSTKLAKAELASRKRKVLEESAEQLALEQQKGKKLQKGLLQSIIQATANKHGLSNCDLSESTVRSRVKRDNIHCGGYGPESPMKAIEPMLVQLYIQKARMGQPMGQAEGLTFANSLIAGTPYLTELRNFQEKNFKMTGDNLGTLGYRYWQGFKKRNKDKIDSGVPTAQDVCRKEWSTYHNFASMYNMDYKQMEEAHLLEELAEPAWMDEEGNIVPEDKALGLKVTHKMKHPEYMLFVDEVGSNTNMKEDGRIGGEKLLKEPGSKANITASTADANFTLLGFTAGTGEPIMCAIIFAAAEMQADWQFGIDVRQSLNDAGVSYYRDNHGPGKRFPGGPSCHFRGKEVPCFVCCSPKGGVTSELLASMLKRMDDLELSPREEGGPVPFLQLDGHGSRLQLPFLRYINDPEHKWIVCLGLPNGTAKWQLGDSSEQNGCYKMAGSRAKRNLVAFKMRMGVSISLRQTDIIPIVNIAWAKSFAQVESNKKAIAHRGWGPLNRALLNDKDILKTKGNDDDDIGGSGMSHGDVPPHGGAAPHEGTAPEGGGEEEEQSLVSRRLSWGSSLLDATTRTPPPPRATTSAATTTNTNLPPTGTVIEGSDQWSTTSTITTGSSFVVPPNLNLLTGIAGDVITDVVQYVMKDAAVKQRLKLRLDQGRAFRTDLATQEGKRMTAGVLFKGGRVRLDGEILQYFEAKQNKMVSDQKERVERLTAEYNTTKEAAETVIALNVPLSMLTNPQLKTVNRRQVEKEEG